jgi:E3 ubiquitin-protein ligase BAH
MKFAHELKEALRREGFPPHWVESAVPYGLLKKSIKKVEAELRSLGLDAETLRRLVRPPSSFNVEDARRGSGDAAVAFQYQFGGKVDPCDRD